MKNRGLLGWAAPASGAKGPVGRSATAGLLARRLAAWIGGLVALAVSTATADDRTKPRLQGHSPQELANEANNPNAPLAQLQLRDVIAPRVPGTEGTGNLLQLLSVLPFKRGEIFPFPTTMKITVPLVTVPGPDGTTAMGDIQVFDQVVFKEPWGSWAVGLSLVFPSATAKQLGQQTWQAGPAAGIMFTGIRILVVGAIVQNPVSLNSSSHRPKVNALSVAPTLTYTLPDGWFVGYSDFNWSLNWEAAGGTTIPLGLQAGKVIQVGKQAFSLSIEAGYNLVRPADDAGIPQWMIGLEVTALFPGL